LDFVPKSMCPLAHLDMERIKEQSMSYDFQAGEEEATNLTLLHTQYSIKMLIDLFMTNKN